MTVDFNGVYLLYSLNPKFRGRIYIGYTVNPSRRINQHNKGSKYGGAKRTSNKGPWEMSLIVYGFPNDVSALRFEWAWQNPLQSRRLNSLPTKRVSESYLEYHLRILNAMLSSSPWIRLPLTVHCLNTDIINGLENYIPSKPAHMEILEGPNIVQSAPSPQPLDSIHCDICKIQLRDVEITKCYNDNCSFIGHITCLASHFLKGTDDILPIAGNCPSCNNVLIWGKLVNRHLICS